MALINITTTPEEHEAVLAVLRNLVGTTVAVSMIAGLANLNKNRVRYILSDLEEANKIKRTPTKSFNSHYIRYKYEVL